MIDIKQVRRDTPACEKQVHFNNAGASLMPLPVVNSVIHHIKLEQNIGGYEAEASASKELENLYVEFAKLLNASAHEIAFTENATRAWDMAFYGMPLQSGDRILTHESEYVSNYLAFLQQAQRRGIVIDLVPSDASGQIDVQALEAMIVPRTRLIAITHVPSQGGLVNPVEAVGAIARKHDLLYLLDACQSVGQLPVDVKKIDCHVLSGTGRKFLRGPRGTGFLYVRSDMIEKITPPFIDLRAANFTGTHSYELVQGAKRYENWESNVSGRIGLMEAVRYARNIGLEAIETRVSHIAVALRSALATLPNLDVQDLGIHKCGIVTFSVHGQDCSAIQRRLSAENINVSIATALPFVPLDLRKRGINALIRASVHYYNTENEIDKFIETLRALHA